MDDLDHQILSILRRDARTPYTEIADRVGTSEGTVRNRVDRLTVRGSSNGSPSRRGRGT